MKRKSDLDFKLTKTWIKANVNSISAPFSCCWHQQWQCCWFWCWEFWWIFYSFYGVGIKKIGENFEVLPAWESWDYNDAGTVLQLEELAWWCIERPLYAMTQVQTSDFHVIFPAVNSICNSFWIPYIASLAISTEIKSPWNSSRCKVHRKALSLQQALILRVIFLLSIFLQPVPNIHNQA